MDFPFFQNNNSQQQQQQVNQQPSRLPTAQFGGSFEDAQSSTDDYIEKQYQQQFNTQALTGNYMTRQRCQQPSQEQEVQQENSSVNNNNNNNGGSSNIVSALIPKLVTDFFHNYWQKEPIQQNELQQKQVIKANNQMEEAQQKVQQKNQIAINDSRKKLKELGVNNEYILEGEKYIQDIQAGLKSATFRLEGKLILTNFKLIFVVTNGKYESLGSPDFYQIYLMLIQSCERTVEKKGNQFSYIDIECKDVRKYQFRFNFEKSDESFEFMTRLIENAFNKDIQKYPAFMYKKFNNHDQQINGWNIYDVKKEFERMKLHIFDSNTSHQDQNQHYVYKFLSNEQKEICETYPPVLVVPNFISDDVIKKCSKFRSRERLPVMTFAFKNSHEQKLPVTLWRCSQCKTGLNSRSVEDEEMLRYIGDPTNKDNRNPNCVNVHIYDARPFMNAVGNKLAGKGYENTSFYKNCEIYFLDIHNIHKVRDSFNKVVSLCQSIDQQVKWYKEIDSSLWLEHISTIISGSMRICQSMQANNHVVVHCSDGWDRTSQLCSLAQIFLDPHYRTIEGFCTLVQKDWVYFGHQFNLRQNHGQRNQTDEMSPIFLQFLDCVHQVMNMYPLSFEFNDQFLVDLAFSSYNCLFGTFLCNYYHESVKLNVPIHTVSVWSWILKRRAMYQNPFYKRDDPISILKPDFQQRSLKLWTRFFCYYQFQKLDEYKIDTSCRFNEDNVQNQQKKSQDTLSFYESVFQELNLPISKMKSPQECANQMKQLIIQEYKFNQSQLRLQGQQQQEEEEFYIIHKLQSKIQ